MTEHHRLLSQDRLRCACGWSVPWPAVDRWGEIWDAHIQAVESALPQGARAGDDTPWPLTDVLHRLVAFARHCLDDHCCDQQGYEAVGDAIAAALRYAGAVTPASSVVPPAPVAYRHEDRSEPDAMPVGDMLGATPHSWRRHAVAAYQQEEVVEQERSRANHDALLAINSTCVYDDDEADCDALAGDEVAGSEVRE